MELLRETLKKSKIDFYDNLVVKNVTENRFFWKIIKLHFPEKSPEDARRLLVEKSRIYHTTSIINGLVSVFKNDLKLGVQKLSS